MKNDTDEDFVSEHIQIDMMNLFELTTESPRLQGWKNTPPVDYKDTIQWSELLIKHKDFWINI